MRTHPLILIADDEPVIRDLYRGCLDGYGYEIITAADGEETLATARERLPD